MMEKEDQEVIEILKAFDEKLNVLSSIDQTKRTINLNIMLPTSLKRDIITFAIYLAALSIAFTH